MFKKRAMSDHRFMSGDVNDSFLPVKSIDTGYASNQPEYPYWVQPLNYSIGEWNEINTWVENTMGTPDWTMPDCRWVGSYRKYWFRDERDRTMFILKWS